MSNKKLQSHWEDIYQHKQPTEVSWTQDYPITTMELLKDFTDQIQKFLKLDILQKM